MLKIKDTHMILLFNLISVIIVCVYLIINKPKDKIEKENHAYSQSQLECEQVLQECVEELLGSRKYSKLWNYAQQLELENARLNKLLVVE